MLAVPREQLMTLIIAVLILVGGSFGGVVIRPAVAQSQSNPAGLWILLVDSQTDYGETVNQSMTIITSPYVTNLHTYQELALEAYLNVTKDGTITSFGTSGGEYLEMYSYSYTEFPPSQPAYVYGCSSELRQSFVLNINGSVTDQRAKLSGSHLTITQNENQTMGNDVASCSLTDAASYFESSVLELLANKHLPWVDNFTFSSAPESQQYQTNVGVTQSEQTISIVNVALFRLQSYCAQYTAPDSPPVCVASGVDDQGPISPPVNIPSPNTVTLPDGSTINLGGSTLSWNSPGNYTLDCSQDCASDSFNFVGGSRGTIVSVNCPSGPCATITAISGANFSLSAEANHVTVNDFDGVVRVGALNSSSTVYLSGTPGTYSQRVTVNTNENLTTLQKNVTSTYATVLQICNSGTTLLNSGKPISGDLSSIQFCVPPGQVSKLQFYVPPSLQGKTGFYTATSNSSTIAMTESGENNTGGTASGIMALSGIPTEMPITLVSSSGNDLVTVVVNNTGSAAALVMFRLQFPSLTTSTSSNNTLLYTTVVVLLVAAIMATVWAVRRKKS